MNMQGIDMIFSIAILIMSVVIHEVSHGVVANWLGDPTAKYAGRLTLNPIPHLDLFGSVLLPAFFILVGSPIFFAYAKPVPYNPYNLSNQRWGPAMVGVAGPISNILVAIIFAIVLNFGVFSGEFLGIFIWIIQINIWLALFNLIPIPPLDGSKLLFSVLPARLLYWEQILEQYGFFLLIALLFILPDDVLLVPLSRLATIIVGLLIGV